MFDRLILATCLSLAAAGSIASQGMPFDAANYRYFYLSDMAQEEVLQRLQNPEATDVLVCPEGTRLPVSFAFKGDLIELDSSKEGAYSIVMKQTFYLRLAEEQVLISLDGHNWKQWDELLTGMISVTLSHGQDSPRLQLGGEAHFRP